MNETDAQTGNVVLMQPLWNLSVQVGNEVSGVGKKGRWVYRAQSAPIEVPSEGDES